MLGKRLINTGGAGACTTDTVQILDPDSTQSTALYRFEDNANDTAYTAGTTVSSYKIIDLDVNGYSSGATISNSASNTDDATKNGTATYSNPSGSNGRFDLDGASDYLEITGNTTFNGATNYTLEGWFKPDNLTALDHFFAIHDGSSGSKFYVRVNDAQGDIDAMVYGSTGTGSTAASIVTNNTAVRLQANVFNHVVMTYTDGSGGLLSIYINGALAGSAAATGNGNTTGTADFLIGTLGGYIGAYDFDGEVGQIRFYISALSATEVLQNYNATRALYAAHDGTASNVTYTTGKFGKAALFNGSNSVIDIPYMRTVMNNDFAVSFWYKTPSTFASSGYPAIVSMYGYLGYGSAYGWIIEHNNNAQLSFYWVSSSGVGNYMLSNALSANTWYHVVCQKNASSAAIYVNGVSENAGGSINSYAMYYNNFNRMTIGAKRLNYGSTSGHISGTVDQLRLFTKQLSLGEINSLYNETATSAASGTIDNPSTVAYYKMADATDETGSYNGTAYGIDFNVQGKYGFAGKFSGSSGSYIQTGYTALSGTSASISLWVNIHAYTTYGGFAIDSTGAGAAARFTLGQGSTAGKLWVSVGNGSTSWYDETTVSISSYGLGNWFHLVGTINGTTVKIYINGSLIHTFTSSVSYVGGGQHTYYLGGWGNSLLLNGKLDQIRFFNKEISLSEVAKLYNEIQCPNTITAPESYFNTVLYNGDSSTKPITVGFKPDLVIVKSRTQSGYEPTAFDTIRGVLQRLRTSESYQEDTKTGSLTSFDINGFTTGNYAGMNSSGQSYVAWAWKAASSNTTNNDGTISSTVRASQESGFSIVKATFNTSSPQKIGHGLTSAPEFIISKRTSMTSDWNCYHKSIDAIAPEDYLIKLNSSDAKSNNSIYWNDTAPTSSVFTTGSIYDQNETVIFYCFHSVDGYQKIGSYVGTGTPENFIYTGFEPAWVLIKNTSTGSTNWVIVDNKRDNADEWLYADANSQTYDDANTYTRFYENGFSVANNGSYVNTSGDNYIFLAIAANPDTTAPTKANSFNKLLYTGDDSNNRSITGLGFKPDFLWIKRRVSGSEPHALYDSVRGPNLQLSSDTAGAEALNSGSYLGMSSFDDDGFNVGNNGGTNRAPNTYVAWAWKGLDHDRNLASINNDGSIKSLVSVNDAAGFSIVKYKGNETASQTVGHGLSSSPQIAFIKQLDGGRDWVVALFTESSGDFMHLNSAQAESTDTNKWSAVSSTTFTVGNDPYTNSSGSPMIAYCWYSVTGHSSIGKYSGSGSSGKQVTGLGFTPSFLMIKRTDSAGGWRVQDNSRLGTSGTQKNVLEWNDPAAEQSNYVDISFDLNGFTLNTTAGDYNASGTNNYIYMAFK